MKNLTYGSLLVLFFACTGCNTDIVTGEDPGDPIGADGQDGTDGQAGHLTDAELALSLVNDIRAAGCTCGGTRMPPVAALSLSSDLNRISRSHAEDQAARNQMSHVGSDGSRVGDRATRGGYAWRKIGENVARGYFSVEAVIDGWKGSAGHCRNMMQADFVHMGFGEEELFYAQAFGTPR